MTETRRWICAVLIAAVGKWNWRNPLALFRPAVVMFLSLLPDEEVEPEIADARIVCCGMCDLYVPVLDTCGSPLVDEQLGCWCKMKKKSKLKSATCWARTNKPELNIGWPAELMYE